MGEFVSGTPYMHTPTFDSTLSIPGLPDNIMSDVLHITNVAPVGILLLCLCLVCMSLYEVYCRASS